MKILIIVLFTLLSINSFLSWHLWNENQKNRQNIGFLENKIDRLDIDALEKIKSKEVMEVDCNSESGGNWISDAICI